jgi:hypothetical protein
VKRVLASAAVLLLGAATPSSPFRFSRPIETLPGWSRLEIPEDVLDVSRPGLPDLRILDEGGKDVPYAFEFPGGGTITRLLLQDVESAPKRETTALVDRGAKPPLAESVSLEIEAEDFLKPVAVEASDDRESWKQIALGSLFSAGGIRWTTLRFPANDRRYLRFRLDDRNGRPVQLLAAWIEAAGASARPREIPLKVSAADAGGNGISRLDAALPAANLGIAALRLEVSEPAYWRRVRVFERVFFRDEVCRRLVAEGTISRSPGTEGKNDLPVCGLFGKNLEIEIENGDSLPLHLAGVSGVSWPRAVLFFAPENARLTLEYGSPSARSPRYDLSSAIAAGRPLSTRVATLGKPADRGLSGASLAQPPLGPAVDSSAWKHRQRIELPDSGNIAYLDLDSSSADSLPSIRVVDRENRQVPFLIEQDARRTRLPVQIRSSVRGSVTVAAIDGLDPSRAIEAVEISAGGPDYFSREVTVVEDETDARGVTGQRVLGRARWERRPEEQPLPLRVAISRPAGKSVRAEVENGDNAPLSINRVAVWIETARLDFVFSPGQELFLLFENPEAHPARYDLEMVAAKVLESPARAARLAPPEKVVEKKQPLSAWFWVSIVLAVLLLTVGLARTLKSPPESPRP